MTFSSSSSAVSQTLFLVMFSRHVATRMAPMGRCFSSSTSRHADFTHAVIGAGAVGLAVARRLQQVEGAQVVLMEKHGMVGSETSSRNSEVIHAGIYYGADTLKTKLCIQGKEMMYDLCKKNDIAHMNCGKWVVAQTDEQMGECKKVHDFAKSIGVPIRYVSRGEAQSREPEVRAEAGVLESPTTGIVDSHGFMQFLQGDFENEGGTLALLSPVTQIQPPSVGNTEWKIWTGAGTTEPSPSSPTPQVPAQNAQDQDTFITAETVINSAGLYGCAINNMILPPERHRTAYYAKGSYFTYSKSHPKPSTLVYPAPTPGLGGLGTHLTIDMAGQIRFGPDVEWVDSPTDLAPSQSTERFKKAIEEIQSFMPNVDVDAISLGYAGIRPKLGKMGAVASDGKGIQDFHIKREEGVEGFVNLLGIESPGLTSSLAIAEEVHRILYR